MKNIFLIITCLIFFTGCNSTNQTKEKSAGSNSQSPGSGSNSIEGVLFYKNGGYKPVMITLNENYNDEAGNFFLYFIKLELGEEGVHLTYIYNNSKNGTNTRIIRLISREQYISFMKKVLSTKILDLAAYDSEDPVETHNKRGQNVFEFNLESQVLRFYYNLDDLGSDKFRQQKNAIDVIKNAHTYLKPNN